MDALHKIVKLEMERHELYKKAGNRKATESDRARIGEIASRLNILWDQHRREDAARRWADKASTKRKTDAA